MITLRRKLTNVEFDVQASLISMIDDGPSDEGAVLTVAGQKVAVVETRAEVRAMIAKA